MKNSETDCAKAIKFTLYEHPRQFPFRELPGMSAIFRKILLHEVHFLDLEGLAVQVGQGSGVGGKGEGEFLGLQGLVGPVEALVQLAVFAVA